MLAMKRFVIAVMAVAGCGSVNAKQDAPQKTPDAPIDNPGGCDCSATVQHAMSTCNAGACDYTSCNTGYADVDGDRTNGCESTLPTGVAEASHLVLWLPGDKWNGTTWSDQSG